MGKTIVYNKLVRDLIPEVIEKDGKTCVTHIADDEEYRKELSIKLQEEVAEFLEKPCEEELADILEVIDGLVALYGFSHDKIGEIKAKKREKRGGFQGRVMLERVEE